MCAVSKVFDDHFDRWNKPPYSLPLQPMQPYNPLPMPLRPTQQEIDEFYKLLERAREYDKKHNEPDCESEEKKQRLKKLADELGVEIAFP